MENVSNFWKTIVLNVRQIMLILQLTIEAQFTQSGDHYYRVSVIRG